MSRVVWWFAQSESLLPKKIIFYIALGLLFLKHFILYLVAFASTNRNSAYNILILVTRRKLQRNFYSYASRIFFFSLVFYLFFCFPTLIGGDVPFGPRVKHLKNITNGTAVSCWCCSSAVACSCLKRSVSKIFR